MKRGVAHVMQQGCGDVALGDRGGQQSKVNGVQGCDATMPDSSSAAGTINFFNVLNFHFYSFYIFVISGFT